MVIMIITFLLLIVAFLYLCLLGVYFVIKDSNSLRAKKIRYKLAGKRASYRLTEQGQYTLPEHIITHIENIAYSTIFETSKDYIHRDILADINLAVRRIKDFECGDYKIYLECLEYVKLHINPIESRVRDYPDEPVDKEFVQVELSTLANKLAKRRTITY